MVSIKPLDDERSKFNLGCQGLAKSVSKLLK